MEAAQAPMLDGTSLPGHTPTHLSPSDLQVLL